ncbi:hypothetical protein V8F20_004851 [Naviculisporaceae sp. PSN 640]
MMGSILGSGGMACCSAASRESRQGSAAQSNTLLARIKDGCGPARVERSGARAQRPVQAWAVQHGPEDGKARRLVMTSNGYQTAKPTKTWDRRWSQSKPAIDFDVEKKKIGLSLFFRRPARGSKNEPNGRWNWPCCVSVYQSYRTPSRRSLPYRPNKVQHPGHILGAPFPSQESSPHRAGALTFLLVRGPLALQKAHLLPAVALSSSFCSAPYNHP